MSETTLEVPQQQAALSCRLLVRPERLATVGVAGGRMDEIDLLTLPRVRR